MARCPRCGSVSASGCQCSFVDSDTIDFSGSGDADSPFTGDVILDSTTAPVGGNKAHASSFGILVPTYPYCKVYDSTGQIRADSEPLIFDAEAPHGDQFNMHSNTAGSNTWVNILEDGWHVLHSRCSTEDDALLTDVILRIRDFDTRDIIGQSNSPRITVDGVGLEVYEEAWLTTGMKVCSTIDFSGPATITIQGGGSYGHRTNLLVRKVHEL